MDMVGYLSSAQDNLRALQPRLGGIKPLREFFDVQRVSRPADLADYTKRATYNVRYFSSNYAIVVALMGVWSLLSNPLLLIAMGFLVGGFLAIGRFVPEPIDFRGKPITPQNLYTILFCIGIPVLWWAAPLSTLFGIIGSSACIIGLHAGLLEPGVESEYEGVEQV